jgi:hypothetical protein
MSGIVKHAAFTLATVFAATSALTLSGSLPAHAAEPDLWGCPSGAVCIYSDGLFDHRNAAYITDYYWSYGAHDLVDQIGRHRIVNNQYGGPNATVLLCYGYGGTNCTAGVVYPDGGYVADITPINSIVLNSP